MAYKVTRNGATGQLTLMFYRRPRGDFAHRGWKGEPSRRVLFIDWDRGWHYHATKGWRGGPCTRGPKYAADEALKRAFRQAAA